MLHNRCQDVLLPIWKVHCRRQVKLCWSSEPSYRCSPAFRQHPTCIRLDVWRLEVRELPLESHVADKHSILILQVFARLGPSLSAKYQAASDRDHIHFTMLLL